MQKNKGFTLIELLVVIAIIGILASVVLASLGGARQKGADAKIQAQLSNMRSQAMLYSGTNGTAALGTCDPTSTTSLFGTADNGLSKLFKDLTLTGSQCYSNGIPNDGGVWVVAFPLSSGAFCVDSTGWASSRSRAGTLYTVVTGTFGGAVVPALNGTACR